jgi:hypothetical protein
LFIGGVKLLGGLCPVHSVCLAWFSISGWTQHAMSSLILIVTFFKNLFMNQRRMEALQFTLLSITTWFTILSHSLHSKTFQRPSKPSTPASVRVNKCGDSPQSDLQKSQNYPQTAKKQVIHSLSRNLYKFYRLLFLLFYFLPAKTLQIALIFQPSYHILIVIQETGERLGFQDKHTDITLLRRTNSKTKRTSSF